ncbi:MAG: stage V sporulation protein D, partial [Planctomycetota bacterium]
MLPLKKHRFRANIIGVFLIIAFIALSVHLGRVQLIDHDKYIKLAKSQQSKKIVLPARRGLILDRNGNKLAESLQVGSIYADPTEIEDLNAVASHLSAILKPIPSKLAKIRNKSRRFVWIKRKVGDEELNTIAKLSLKGIYVQHEYHRFYPNNQLASHILGFTNIDGKGLEGIELLFDNVLSGKSGFKLINRDALQRQIITPDAEIQLPRHGNNVVLT